MIHGPASAVSGLFLSFHSGQRTLGLLRIACGRAGLAGNVTCRNSPRRPLLRLYQERGPGADTLALLSPQLCGQSLQHKRRRFPAGAIVATFGLYTRLGTNNQYPVQSSRRTPSQRSIGCQSPRCIRTGTMGFRSIATATKAHSHPRGPTWATLTAQ